MKNKIQKDKFQWKNLIWGLIVLLIIFMPFVIAFTICETKRGGETLANREIIFQRMMNEGQAMIAYPSIDRLHFVDDDYHFTFNLSDAPKALQDLALHKASLPRPLIERHEILPQASWIFRSGQRILVYPELDIVAFAEGDDLIGYWKSNEAPEIIKRILSDKKE